MQLLFQCLNFKTQFRLQFDIVYDTGRNFVHGVLLCVCGGYSVVSGDFNDFLQMREARSINFWLVLEEKMIFILFAYRTLVSNTYV